MFGLFKAKKAKEIQKRNFENVGWNWVKTKNGKEINPFHIFSFSNGLGVIVFQNAVQTWDGMMCIAITDYKEDLGYAPLCGVDLPKGVYTRAEGLDEEGVKNFCNTIRNLRKW